VAGFEERYEVGDARCGVITYCKTFSLALEAARRIKLGLHRECFVTVFDRMAHRGAVSQWDAAGKVLAIKEQEVTEWP